ncbi:MAG: hypothetical protein KJ950_01410 [Proteobacteria bacterium]|nr:hypothetical protein [Pseudomonadota bacterium]MBU1687343.1 hypothetical protein [Pseudomonadota bacterium]
MLSDGGVFPDYLEQIDSDIQAVNFGENGIDSLLVRERVREALKIARPDLMFVLLGDNDYNTAFHNSIIPTYFDRLGWLLRLPYLFESEPAEITHFASHDFYWYKRLHQPELFNFLQKIGLFNIDIQKYQPINSLITQYCTQNLGVILDMASAQQIPVVVMTPIENLRAEPFGDIKTTTTLYKRGLSSTDYGESIRLLKAAKDTELFTYDLRAKSDIIESIRSLNRKNVYVLDLEKVLEKREFAFGSEDFVDYVHYNDRTHLMVADILYDFLSHNHLIE